MEQQHKLTLSTLEKVSKERDQYRHEAEVLRTEAEPMRIELHETQKQLQQLVSRNEVEAQAKLKELKMLEAQVNEDLWTNQHTFCCIALASQKLVLISP